MNKGTQMSTQSSSSSPGSVQNRENGENTSEYYSISINDMEADAEWIASLQGKINETPKLLSKSAGKNACCIFRVPQSLVEINKKAYHPHIVSIGPYHHGSPHLNIIQEHKGRFLGALLSRTQARGVGLYEFYKTIAPMEEKIRDCYSETIQFSSRDLIEMMVLDGCFIIEVFCIVGRVVLTDHDDPLFKLPWVFSFLIRDLLRLENQIPYFVLRTLFDMSMVASGKENTHSLPSLALKFFNLMVQRSDKILKKYDKVEGNHLLDLFRLSYLPLNPHPEDSKKGNPSIQLIPSAKKLHLAGVKFKTRKSDSFLAITFNNGVLEIPTLTLDDFTSSVFMNFVAFEQCSSHCSNHITTYVTFMGCLINTPGDAGFLCDQKAVENYYGTEEEMARFFNNVRKDVVFDIRRTYLEKQFKDVYEYSRNSWHVRWAGFKHTYFDTPWSFVSALAAIVLLLLTMIQAFFAAYAYVNPP